MLRAKTSQHFLVWWLSQLIAILIAPLFRDPNIWHSLSQKGLTIHAPVKIDEDVLAFNLGTHDIDVIIRRTNTDSYNLVLTMTAHNLGIRLCIEIKGAEIYEASIKELLEELILNYNPNLSKGILVFLRTPAKDVFLKGIHAIAKRVAQTEG